MIQGLLPIRDKDARLLILGSMPGGASLKAQQYYAHPQNAFWKILTRVYGPAESYKEKAALLKKHKLALWNVIETCERKGSLDTAIKDPKCNDLKAFLKKHPKIKRILLNGGTAHNFYMRYAKTVGLTHGFTRLPSTSPANTMRFEEKLKVWKKALV